MNDMTEEVLHTEFMLVNLLLTAPVAVFASQIGPAIQALLALKAGFLRLDDLNLGFHLPANLKSDASGILDRL